MKLILSDIHLRSPEDANYRRLRSLLDELRDKVSELYILGDLFEFWFGYRHLVLRDDLPVIASLLQYKESGIPMTYIVGNHDYHPGPVFSELLSARIVRNSTEETWEETKVHLSHGDLANPRDWGYRLLRAVLRSRAGLFIPHLIPPTWLRRVALAMSRTSKRVRDASDILVQAQKEYALREISRGTDLVIQGHSHHPWLEEVSAAGSRGISANSGDGMHHYTCLIWDKRELGLYCYKDGPLKRIKSLHCRAPAQSL